MKRILLGVIASLLITAAHAESEVAENELADIQKAIDESVWKTFQNAFEQMDGEALNSLYADEVLRVTPEGIDTSNSFKQTNKTRFDENKLQGDRIELDFWFDSRHTNSKVSYNVGFYRVRVTDSSEKTSIFYGQFHIVLMNLDGRWMIVQDWDTATIGGRPITADDFSRMVPVRF